MDKIIILNSNFKGMVIDGNVSAVVASDLKPLGYALTDCLRLRNS